MVGSAGQTLISEALYYGKPLIVFPIKQAFEQFLNAFYVEKLGYGRNSGSMCVFVKKRCIKDGISTSHFIGNKGRKTPRKSKLILNEIMVKNSKFYNTNRLKKRLIKEGLKEDKCEVCGQLPVWNGEHLVLQMDHINGDNTDNRMKNLRIICPNCHTQTDTFSCKTRKNLN